MTSLLAGLVLGLAGSLHCAGMCGPILLAVNRSASGRDAITRMLVYHAARIFIYGVLGAVAGATGRVAASAGLGRTIAIASGTLLVLGSIGVVAARWPRPLSLALSSVALRTSTFAAALTRQQPLAGHAVLGIANGLLPCGLLYAALATSLALGTVARSVAFMAGFGFGTVPVLIALTISAASIPATWRRRLRFAAPMVMVAAGTVLIVWGVLPVESAAHHHDAAILTHQQ